MSEYFKKHISVTTQLRLQVSQNGINRCSQVGGHHSNSMLLQQLALGSVSEGVVHAQNISN